jgi:enoyl-CoA hydratase/carnithine racemase
MPTAVMDDTPSRQQSGLLSVTHDLSITHVRLNRPAKRNALSDTLIESLRVAFSTLPQSTQAVVLSGEGGHFCAGLDLAEMSERDVAGGIVHSRGWHSAFEQVQFGRVPVIAVLHGAVVGGGLELASAAHIRVAEASAFYALPEGQRGLFVGGGGSARIPRLVGVPCMTDMMMTGRVLTADEGQQRGISQYLVAPGLGLQTAFGLARKVAGNAPLSNFAVMHALPRIADMSQSDGLFVESLMAAIAQGDGGAKGRMRAFLDGRAAKVGKP